MVAVDVQKRFAQIGKLFLTRDLGETWAGLAHHQILDLAHRIDGFRPSTDVFAVLTAEFSVWLRQGVNAERSVYKDFLRKSVGFSLLKRPVFWPDDPA